MFPVAIAPRPIQESHRFRDEQPSPSRAPQSTGHRRADEAAMLACSVYVDLNPIRAGLATTPEESAHLGGSQPSADCGSISDVAAQVETMRHLPARASDQGFLPIEAEQYIMVLDWTGRELRADKRGAIPDHLAPILDRLGLNRSNWVETVRGFGRLFKQAAGRSSSLVDAAARCSRCWFQGKAAARAAFV